MEDKKPDLLNRLMFLTLLAVFSYLSFFMSKTFADWRVQQKRHEYHYNYGASYMTGYSSVDAFVKLQDLPAVAIQSKGKIDSTQNFLMSENYRYRSSYSLETNQSDKEFYHLSIYDINASEAEPIEINLFDYLPDYKKGTQFSDFDVSLYEKDQQPFIVVSYNAREGDKFSKKFLRFELIKAQKALKVSKVSGKELVKGLPNRKSKVDPGYLGRMLSIAASSGEDYLSGPKETNLTFGLMEISANSFNGEQRDIFSLNEKLLDMAKDGPYRIILTEDFSQNQEETQKFLDAFRKVGQANYVDGLAVKPKDKIATIDGQEHLLTGYEDIEHWVYKDFILTDKEFTSRDDVQAILQDSNSTLLPIGINPSDNSLVTYDMAQGPLYQVGSTHPINYYGVSKLEKSLTSTQSNRSGFVSKEAVISVSTSDYFNELPDYIDRINNGNADQELKQLLFFNVGYDDLYGSERQHYIDTDKKESLKRIVNEGIPVGLYSVLDVSFDAVNQGLFTISPEIMRRGYLIDGSSENIDKSKSQITSAEDIDNNLVSNSVIFVQNGKAVTVKLPGE